MRFILCLSAAGLLVWALSGTPGAEPGEAGVRRAILAGTWYPAEAEELESVVRGFLGRAAPPELQGELRALIVPHAGYRYSGEVAAWAYKLLEEMRPSRIILVGPSHRHRFSGVSVSMHRAYETPLGRVDVDVEFALDLAEGSPEVGFVPRAHAGEHSLEIQLPFVQTVSPGVPVVPVVMGDQDLETCSLLASLLAEKTAGRPDTLIVASTDLSHFHQDHAARELDGRFMRYMEEADPEGLHRALAEGRCEACGGGAVVTALLAAREAGPCRGVALRYATSGDVTGDRGRVVGYLAGAVISDPRRGG